MNIGTVVEGPTDRMVLEAVLQKILPDVSTGHRFFPLQPSITLGETGAGWKGVRKWCRQTWQRPGSSLDLILSGKTGPALDLLIIHVDADVACENDLQEGCENPISDVQQPCPPVISTITRLEQVIGCWLDCDNLPPHVVLAIPAQDTESWTFAALFPNDELCNNPDYECIRSGRDHPGYRLTLKRYGRLLHRQSGEIKKSQQKYSQIVHKIASNWEGVCKTCTQAECFMEDVKVFME